MSGRPQYFEDGWDPADYQDEVDQCLRHLREAIRKRHLSRSHRQSARWEIEHARYLGLGHPVQRRLL